MKKKISKSKIKTKAVKKVKKTAPKKKKVIKKVATKKSIKKVKSIGKLVGKVTHYFSDISVAVIKVSAPIKEGDEIRIMGGENTDFNQKAKSLQVDHKPVKVAKKGKSVGLKVSQKAREGYKVYKV